MKPKIDKAVYHLFNLKNYLDLLDESIGFHEEYIELLTYQEETNALLKEIIYQNTSYKSSKNTKMCDYCCIDSPLTEKTVHLMNCVIGNAERLVK